MGDDVEYPTEYMNSLANTRQTRWDTDSSEGIKKIRDALADESSFGDVPELASYGRVFTQVRTIYLETMRGAKVDLDAVAQAIKTSARQMTDNDDAAGAAFLDLWQKWEHGPLDSTRNQEQASSTPEAQEAAVTMSIRPLLRALRRVLAMVAAGAIVSLCVAVPSAGADALDDGQWWRSAMGVEELHRSGAGKGVTIALIDGPIDSSVPELTGRIASSTTECLAPGGGKQPASAQGVEADHATRMASLIVGSGKGTASDGRGISGIAPEATLRHYAVTYPSASDPTKLTCGLTDPSLNETSEATARAIQQAVKDGARVISISLTTDYDDEYVAALLDAYRAGAVVVASTNNETRKVFWPGIGNGVVTVTHVDSAGNLDTSAMRKSSFVDFAAPGTKVAAGQWTSSGWRSDVISDGSSQATAITAGGIAAVWSAHPDATGNQVLQAMKDQIGLRAENGKYLTWFRRVGDNLPRATGKTESYGFGIADPADAVKVDVESLPDTNPMVTDKGVVMPTAAEIAAATSAAPSSAATSTPAPSPSTTSAARDASTVEGSRSAAEDSGSSTLVWLFVGAGGLALLAGLAVLLRRRSSAQPPHTNDTNDTNDTHDRNDLPAATDGVAAMTKEHSDGTDR